jgi:hypothetical protein
VRPAPPRRCSLGGTALGGGATGPPAGGCMWGGAMPGPGPGLGTRGPSMPGMPASTCHTSVLRDVGWCRWSPGCGSRDGRCEVLPVPSPQHSHCTMFQGVVATAACCQAAEPQGPHLSRLTTSPCPRHSPLGPGAGPRGPMPMPPGPGGGTRVPSRGTGGPTGPCGKPPGPWKGP